MSKNKSKSTRKGDHASTSSSLKKILLGLGFLFIVGVIGTLFSMLLPLLMGRADNKQKNGLEGDGAVGNAAHRIARNPCASNFLMERMGDLHPNRASVVFIQDRHAPPEQQRKTRSCIQAVVGSGKKPSRVLMEFIAENPKEVKPCGGIAAFDGLEHSDIRCYGYDYPRDNIIYYHSMIAQSSVWFIKNVLKNSLPQHQSRQVAHIIAALQDYRGNTQRMAFLLERLFPVMAFTPFRQQILELHSQDIQDIEDGLRGLDWESAIEQLHAEAGIFAARRDAALEMRNSIINPRMLDAIEQHLTELDAVGSQELIVVGGGQHVLPEHNEWLEEAMTGPSGILGQRSVRFFRVHEEAERVVGEQNVLSKAMTNS